MADNKEALPVVSDALREQVSFFRKACVEFGASQTEENLSRMLEDQRQLFGVATAALSELRAEVERYKQALNEALRLVEQEEEIECRGFSCTEAIRQLAASSSSHVGAAQGSAEGGV